MRIKQTDCEVCVKFYDMDLILRMLGAQHTHQRAHWPKFGSDHFHQKGRPVAGTLASLQPRQLFVGLRHLLQGLLPAIAAYTTAVR